MNKKIILINNIIALFILNFNYGLCSELKSSVFSNNGFIPVKYSCDGANISLPLVFSSIPDGTVSLALILVDPDAPVKNFVHWVIYNIPRDQNELVEGIPKSELLEGGIRQGLNGFNQSGYYGPCPPRGETHRYIFKLYALDTTIDLNNATKAQLLSAIKGHVIGKGKLIGKYKS